MELAIQLEQTKKEAVSGGFGPLGWLNHITPSVFVWTNNRRIIADLANFFFRSLVDKHTFRVTLDEWYFLLALFLLIQTTKEIKRDFCRSFTFQEISSIHEGCKRELGIFYNLLSRTNYYRFLKISFFFFLKSIDF